MRTASVVARYLAGVIFFVMGLNARKTVEAF
jgi:hypothetical protein